MNNHNVIASLTSDTGRLNTVLSKIVSDGSGKSFRDVLDIGTNISVNGPDLDVVQSFGFHGSK